MCCSSSLSSPGPVTAQKGSSEESQADPWLPAGSQEPVPRTDAEGRPGHKPVGIFPPCRRGQCLSRGRGLSRLPDNPTAYQRVINIHAPALGMSLTFLRVICWLSRLPSSLSPRRIPARGPGPDPRAVTRHLSQLKGPADPPQSPHHREQPGGRKKSLPPPSDCRPRSTPSEPSPALLLPRSHPVDTVGYPEMPPV